MKNTTQSNKELILRLEKDIALIKQDLRSLKTNDLKHLEQKVDFCLKLLMTIGVMMLGQILYMLRGFI
jgi:uncharacterized protein YaaN involved in tellurite resistance